MITQFKNRCVKVVSALLMVALCSMSALAVTPTDTPVPPPGATAKPQGASVSPAPKLANSKLPNSHLHGATAATTPKTTTAVKGTAKTGASTAKATRWSFTDWAELHRGLGTIRGEVHTANGSPMSGVRVALRSAKGKVLKASRRHVTRTSGSGTFVMKHVRIGSYRVRGTRGKASGHVAVKVHHGETSSATLKV
jgi:hypothetical protein